MNSTATARRLTLTVTNPQLLRHGCTPVHSFDHVGGTIGCRGANWILADNNDRIQPIHCEILVKDGTFCVLDRSGLTGINGSEMPIGQHVTVQLGDGDLLHIGPYQISAHLADQNGSLTNASHPHSQFSVDEIVGAAAHMDILAGSPYIAESDGAADQSYMTRETQSPSSEMRDDLDPLSALDVAEQQSPGTRVSRELDPTHYGMAPARSQPDHAATRFEAVSGSPRPYSGEPRMPSQRAESPQFKDWLNAQSSTHGSPQQSVAPLMQGLGVPLGALDDHTAYQLLLESGQALHAAIRGLTALYANKDNQASRPALLDRTLQPIEDNPLRLGLDYEQTVRALFAGDRSVVHLSPTAAIDESLTQVRRHNEALIEAINASLQGLLRAFSPELLLERFRRYRPVETPPSEAQDWAWQMYSHYYNELASPRQKGFEKLFWEVFEQAYDQALRTDTQ
jgi:type VI secretion system protein ImpI